MKQIALLRGINVGGKHKVPMSELKQLFEAQGYMNVKTYINSGNVLFSGKKASSDQLSELIEEKFGFPVPTLVLSVPTFQKIVDAIPTEWQNNDEYKSDVLFLWPNFDKKTVLDDTPFVEEVDEVLYIPRALIWRVARKLQGQSYMQRKFIGSLLYKNMTARNANTVRALAKLLDK